MKLCERLDGERVYLIKTGCSEELAEEIYQHVEASRKELRPWLDWEISTRSPQDYLRFLEFTQKPWTDGTGFYYLVRDKSDDSYIANLSVNEYIEKKRQALLGYWQSTARCGHGYLTEAVTVLEKALFEAGAHKIVIRTDVLNLKSAAVPQRLGYKLEGILRDDDYAPNENRFRDINHFAKLNPKK